MADSQVQPAWLRALSTGAYVLHGSQGDSSRSAPDTAVHPTENGAADAARVGPVGDDDASGDVAGVGNHGLPADELSLSALLGLLRYTPDEYVSIAHDHGGTFQTRVLCYGNVPDFDLPDEANIYFGVNPIAGPARERAGRGKEADVTRLAALVADIDVGDGKCGDLATAEAIIGELSEILGTRPSAITHSGGGLHPYWPILDGDIGEGFTTADAMALMRRWGRLVKSVAQKHGAKADSVFDLPRVLRAPETFNNKRVNGQGPILVRTYADTGNPLQRSQIELALEEAGVLEADCDRVAYVEASNPATWQFSEQTCSYVQGWMQGIPADDPNGGRHQWLGDQGVRFACARRYGCITEADYEQAKQLVHARMVELRAETREPAKIYEVESCFAWGIEKAASKTDKEVFKELGSHEHPTVWPSPQDPQRVAEKIAEMADDDGMPMVFWREYWLRYNGIRYAQLSNTSLRKMLYDLLRNAVYEKGGGQTARWKPDKGKIDKVIDALKSVVLLGDNVLAPSWRNGRTDEVIAFRNCLLRVSDRELLPHSPEYFNTFAIDCDYEANAAVPKRWDQFRAEIAPGDVVAQETIDEWNGCVLSGRTDFQRMLMVIGPTRSGKGTIDKIWIELVGPDNHVGLAASDMRSDFGLQPLLGKTLAVFSDERVSIDGKKFVETLLRITGEDRVTVNIKNRDAWSGQLGTRLVFMSNEPPALPDSSMAIVGRMIPLHLPVSFLHREDPNLLKDLRAELPGIVNRALDGLDRLNARKQFRIPPSGAKILGLLEESASPINEFVKDKCVLGAEEHLPTEELFDEWKSWCFEHGHDPGSSATFGRKLFSLARNIEKRKHGPKGKQSRHYFGINLSSNVEGGPKVRKWYSGGGAGRE